MNTCFHGQTEAHDTGLYAPGKPAHHGFSSVFCPGPVTPNDPFSDEALGARRSQDIVNEARQAADFGGHDPQYHAALVVIANEEGAGRWARAIDLVSKIWSKSVHEVMSDAVSL